MVRAKGSSGLCSTCVSDSVCSRREGAERSVLYCEEFDDSTGPLEGGEWTRAGLEEPIPPDTSTGLCCDCGNRDSCTMRHSPGGVWHCEQYA